jgi:hypothetical protein
LTFNQIKCEDETEYRCLVSIERTSDGEMFTSNSRVTSIVVKGKYR